MKIVFFGTPYYVLPILNALNKAFKEKSGNSPISAVVTQPPQPAGRQKKLKYSEVDNWAHKRGVPVIFDLDTNKIPKADVGILASYGKIVPKEVINHFPNGILVVHPSVLPEFRGSSPVPASIITDTSPTGVTIFKMDEKLDHGPIVSQLEEEIKKDDTNESLRDRLFSISSENLVSLLPAYLAGKINLKVQDDKKASYANMLTKQDGYISGKIISSVINDKWSAKKNKMEINFIKINKEPYTLNCSPDSINRFILAMTPWPGIWTEVKLGNNEIKRLKISKAHLKDEKLVIDTVQLEGRSEVTWKQFTEGYPKVVFTK